MTSEVTSTLFYCVTVYTEGQTVYSTCQIGWVDDGFVQIENPLKIKLSDRKTKNICKVLKRPNDLITEFWI